MRIAALAFGVLAGLIASLILALGGLDASVALAASSDRQVSLIRFGLFVIANLGVFGAALVLAAPLAGAILLVLGAVGWVVAALLLHHGFDLVLIVPPALLLIATALATVAQLRRGRSDADDERDAALSRDLRMPPEPEDFEELPPVPVGAGFFGQGGTAQPLGSQHPPARDEVRSPRGEDWEPVRRPTPPPRQKSMFRQPDEDDDDEEVSGFSRFAFGFSGVLSFGLYAALAGAAVLVFVNLRTGDAHPGAAKLAPTVSSAAVAALSSASSQPSQAPVLAAAIEPPASSLPPPNPPLSDEASRLQTQAGLTFQTSELPPAADPASTDQASEPPAADASASSAPAGGPDVMPFTMTSEMAAQRQQPAPAPTRTASPATPTPDAGL